MTSRMRQPRGFTLLELVLASAIIATIAAALYGSLGVAFRGRAAAQRQVDAMREAHLTMQVITRDFDSILPAAPIPEDGVLRTLAGPFYGLSTGVGFGSSGAHLEFYTLARDPRLVGTPLADGVRRVELLLRTDFAEPVLVRRVEANLLAETQTDPYEEVIANNIRSFTARYFDGYNWLDEWDSTLQGDILPRAVELTLEFDLAAPRDPTQPYRVVRIIPLSSAQLSQPLTEAIDE